MLQEWLKGLRKYLLWTCAALLVSAGVSRAEDKDAELRALIQEQGRQIQELKKKLEEQQTQPVAAPADGKDKAAPQMTEDAVKKIVAGYLKDNPGGGLPSGVQVG